MPNALTKLDLSACRVHTPAMKAATNMSSQVSFRDTDLPNYVVAVTGASGMPLAVALLRLMSLLPLRVHLIISRAAHRVLQDESDLSATALAQWAWAVYEPDDLGAPPASGSWQHQGMIVCPCSMSSLGHIAQGTGVNLVHRAADVTLKERRPLVLVTRETPLSLIHLRNMQAVSEAGAVVFPPCPSFYHKPASLEDILAQMAGRILDAVDVPHNLVPRWGNH